MQEVTSLQSNASFSLGDMATSSSASAVYFHEASYDVALGNVDLRYDIINSTMFCGPSGFDGSLEFARPVFAESSALEPTQMVASSGSGV